MALCSAMSSCLRHHLLSTGSKIAATATAVAADVRGTGGSGSAVRCRPGNVFFHTTQVRRFVVEAASANSDFIFRQFFDRPTWTYTYLLADPASREAVIIDPVYEQGYRDMEFVNQFNLNLIYGINTHMHSDHVTGTGALKQQLPLFKSVISKAAPAKADWHVVDGDVIEFGKFKLECRSTPGHTNGCMTFVWHEKAVAFTGDALLIRACGATKFFDGDPAKLYKSIHEKIFSLPDSFVLFPGHDYYGHTITTVAEEKKWNTRFQLPVKEFVAIMNELNEFPRPQFNIIEEETLASNITDGLSIYSSAQ